MNDAYKKQAALVLSVLPEIAKEDVFALHGGTAINMFIRDMPRLSIDIDLTYTPIADRNVSFTDINEKLASISTRVKNEIPVISINHIEKDLKLLISKPGALIKIEVNQINRGCIDSPEVHTLCNNAQNEFNTFCDIAIVPDSQLYGGKIIAALDRQHPRDLFDIKHLMEAEGISGELRPGLVLCLLSSNRPIYELLSPLMKDQRHAFENQFAGMTDEPFSYEDFENTRNKLFGEINKLLSVEDKQFLLSFKKLTPDWSVYNLKDFPAVKWKMKNLEVFKEENRKGYDEAVGRLEEFFFRSPM